MSLSSSPSSPNARPSLTSALALAALSGACLFLMLPKTEIWPLAWVGLVPLLWALDQPIRARRAFALGLLAGFVAHLGICQWIVITMGNLNDLPNWVGLLFLLGFAALSGLPMALFAMAYAYAIRRLDPPRALVLLPLYIAYEFMAPLVFLWFLSSAHYRHPLLIQAVDLAGPYGPDAVILLGNALALEALRRLRGRRNRWPAKEALVLTVALLLLLGYGALRLHQFRSLEPTGTLHAAVLQAAISVEDRKDTSVRGRDKILLRYEAMTREAARSKPDVIIWPEGAMSYPFKLPGLADPPLNEGDGKSPPFAFSQRLGELAKNVSTPLVVGGQRRLERRSYNTAVLFGPDGSVTDHYDKVRLLVFGEYLPFRDIVPSLRRIMPGVSNFYPGRIRTDLKVGGQPSAILICYEAILPAFTRASIADDTRVALNLTNDGWFGDTNCPYIHLALVVPRAVENRIPLIRATNTGISAWVDPTGALHQETGLDQKTALDLKVPLVRGRTVYQTMGDAFAWLAVAASALILMMAWRRRKGPSPGPYSSPDTPSSP